MKYNASIKCYDPDDEDDKEFDTREEAAEWLSGQMKYFGSYPSMQLNGVPVRFLDGELVPQASYKEKARLAEDFERIFRPQSSRPTNPATLLAMDKLKD